MPRATFSQIVNRSMSEVLTRSLVTSLSTLFLISMLLFFGGETLQRLRLRDDGRRRSPAPTRRSSSRAGADAWKEREPGYRAARRADQEADGLRPRVPRGQPGGARASGEEPEPGRPRATAHDAGGSRRAEPPQRSPAAAATPRRLRDARRRALSPRRRRARRAQARGPEREPRGQAARDAARRSKAAAARKQPQSTGGTR